MDLITLDFESFYDPEYSLRKLTTEQYIRDPRFEVIGFAVKVNDGPTEWHTGDKEHIVRALSAIDWDNAALLCQNTAFDAGILSFIFGIQPKRLLDTMSMGRAALGVDVSVSLENLAKQYGVGVKGDEVIHAQGKRRTDFTPEDLARYGQYCVNDVELTYAVYQQMIQNGFPLAELKLIDMTLRMFTDPRLHLDTELLKQHLQEVRAAKRKHLVNTLEAIGKPELAALAMMDGESSEPIQKALRSNDQFADLLESLGVPAPTKISQTTGKKTWAFAKTDDGFRALQEHPDVRVQAVVAARLGVKTTLEETRTERFIEMSARGKFPIPLKYAGARTYRWSGMDSVNLQNLPSRGDNTLKRAIQAPEGYVIVGSDLSNIELRVGLWLAKQTDKLRILGDGADLYKDFAAKVFGIAYEDVTKEQRFIGKTCVAEGTLVLSDSGWKPIEAISLRDKLWDGEEWACHHGLLMNGLREVLPIYGAWLTPDHQVWSGTSWKEAISLTRDENTLHRALAIAAENLPLQATYKAQKEGYKPLLSSVTVATMSIPLTPIISKISNLPAAYDVPAPLVQLNATGHTSRPSLTTSIGADCSTASLRQSIDAITQTIKTFTTTALEVFTYVMSGGRISQYSCATPKVSKVGITPNTTWTESTTIKATPPGIFGLSLGKTIQTTEGYSVSLRKKSLVYDIASVGTRNRFTILTDRGPLIVHNCQLALIYGTGHNKLRQAIKVGSGTDIGESESRRIVDLYRQQYHYVKSAWSEGENALECIMHNRERSYGNQGLVKVHGKTGCLLPSGLYLRYPGLQRIKEDNKQKWIYQTRKGKEYLYGAKFFQGLVQSIARCVMGEQMLAIGKRYPIVLTVHDAVYILAPQGEAEEAMAFVLDEMRKPPAWMPDIPLDAEAAFGSTLADC